MVSDDGIAILSLRLAGRLHQQRQLYQRLAGFPIVLILTYLVGSIRRVWQVFDEEGPGTAMAAIHVAFASLGGVFDGVVFLSHPPQDTCSCERSSEEHVGQHLNPMGASAMASAAPRVETAQHGDAGSCFSSRRTRSVEAETSQGTCKSVDVYSPSSRGRVKLKEVEGLQLREQNASDQI